MTVLMTRPSAHPAPAGPPGRQQPRCRTDSLDLGPLPGSVPSARLHVRAILCEWGLGHLADDGESVAAELIANSVQATRAEGLDTPVRLILTTDGASVLLAVWDAVPAPPVQEVPDLDSEHGRGLLIVEALSAWWDCRPVPVGRGGGKLNRSMITRFPKEPPMTAATGRRDELEEHDRLYLDKLRLAIEVILGAGEDPDTLNDVLQTELFLLLDRVQRALLLQPGETAVLLPWRSPSPAS